jgi:hypothetical protein
MAPLCAAGRESADRAFETGTLRPSVPGSGLLVRPRVLTDEGFDRAIVQYETADGVVCLTPHTSESFIVREDGSRVRAHAWPRSISGEIPWGADGAFAWSSGFGNPPDIIPPYVMFRRSASEELSFTPARPAHNRHGWTSPCIVDPA